MSESLQQRTARSAALLLGRTILLRLITLASSIILARTLTPSEFGLFAIVVFIVTFFSTLSDVGLGAALIQQPESPSREELSTTFTTQLLLTGTFVSIGLLTTPAIGMFYRLDDAGLWLIRISLVSLLLGLLRTVPALLLERRLAFGRLSVIEASETISFYGLATLLALAGYGVWSFIWAGIARSLVGVIVAYSVSPWRPSFGISRVVLRRLVRFGLPFQLNTFLSFINESMTPTVLALLVGTTAVGYVNWAFNLAATPLLITNTLTRVAFPAFSRTQSNLALLKTMAERGLRLSAIAFLPISCLLMGAGPQIVRHVFTDKWLPGLLSFYLFSLALWVGQFFSAPFFSVFYATDRPRLALNFIILSAALQWIIGIPFVLLLGYNGVALRSVIAALLTMPFLLRSMRRIMPIAVGHQLLRPLVIAASAGAVEFLLLRILPDSLPSLIGAIFCGALIYAILILIYEREVLRTVFLHLLPQRLRHSGILRKYFAQT